MSRVIERGERVQARRAPRNLPERSEGPTSQVPGTGCRFPISAEQVPRSAAPRAPSLGKGPVCAHAPRRLYVHAGFTLIEILVVITVIAILAGLVAPEVFRNVGDARTTAAKAQMESLSLALDTYRLDNLSYPSTAQGLAALNAAPTGDPRPANWRGPYLRRGVPNDPWGRPYIYRDPGTANPNGYDLLTYGRDGVAGGTGEDADLTSWDSTTVRR